MHTAPASQTTALSSGTAANIAVTLVVMVIILSASKAAAVYLEWAPLFWILLPISGVGLLLVAGTKRWLPASLIAMMLVCALGLLGNHVQDATWDGNMYHKPATVALHDGWNPWRQEFVAWSHDRREPYYAGAIWDGNDNNKWVSHYPNVSWLFGAAMMDLGFGWESTKALGATLGIALLLFATSVLTQLSSRRWLALLAAVLLVLCPPLMAQLATNYVDGPTYAAAALIVLACLAPRRAGGVKVIAWCCLILLAGFKFTGALYAVLLAIPFLLIHRPRFKEILGWTLLGAFVLSHPYLNHLVSGLPIAHPVTGNSQVMANQAEPSMLEGSRPVTLARSLFARTSNTFTHPGLKLPGDVGPGEVDASGIPDTRYAGFGPLFSLALVVAFGALALMLILGGGARSLTTQQRWLLASAGYMLALTLVHAAPWWARYVPFLYLAVVLCLLAGALSRPLATRLMAGAGLVVMLANAGLVIQGVQRYTRGAAIDAGLDIDANVSRSLKDGETLLLQAPPFVGFSAVYHFSKVQGLAGVQYQPVALGHDDCGADQDLGSWIRLVRVCRRPVAHPVSDIKPSATHEGAE